jgi:hypothetical protein
MPIGSSKLGVLGAGLVPGGTETFNAPGTFSIPPGVKKVSITGKGSIGNPGNAGNSGNAGNPGSGGAGGAGGRGLRVACPPLTTPVCNSGLGGTTWKISNSGRCGCLFLPSTQRVNQTGAPFVTRGGDIRPCSPPRCGATGQTGNAGNAGTTGNPGNTGQCSSGLGNNFAGGAGGNAGVAGAAGNGGTGGPGGGTGGDGPPNTTASPGSAGTGGGAGSSGNRQTAPPGGFPFPGCGSVAYGGGGGGGAGAVNSGATGQIGTSPSIYAAGGTGNVTAPVPPAIPGQFPGLGTSTQGGSGGGTSGIHFNIS